MTSLITIPKELQLSIAEYVTSNEDKKSLCLTCKPLQMLITPLLYRNMRIDSRHLNNRLAKTLTAAHRGLPHIRSLRVLFVYAVYDGEYLDDVNSTLHRLISALPQNSLIWFELAVEWHDGFDWVIQSAKRMVNHSLALLIEARQKSVINRQYYSSGPPDPSFIVAQSQALAHVTCLQLYLLPDDCGRAGALMNRALRVNSLTIEFKWPSKALEEYPYGPSGHSKRLALVRSLLGLEGDNTHVLKLKSLRLSGLSLGEFAEHSPLKLQLGGLKHLQLVRCRSVDAFLGALSQLQIGLETFVVDHRLELNFDEANQRFLELLKHSKRLHMVSPIPLVRDWATLSNRASRLRTLRIHDEEHSFKIPIFHRSMTEFSSFCSAATSLEQLSMTSPITTDIEALGMMTCAAD